MKMTVDTLISMIWEEVKEDLKMVAEDTHREVTLERIDFFGDNEHIENPLNHPIQYYFKKRETPLTGEEVVYGDYLLYDCCGHNGTAIIYSCENLEEIESHIMSDGGIRNSFTTYNIAIVFGKVKHYEIVDNEKFVWID